MSGLRRTILVGAGLLLVAALIKEFAQPRGLRVGEGSVFGIPYSFRLPRQPDLRTRYWNPEGNMVAPPLFGVGVHPNLPAIARRFGASR
jgi:hypothetical protein